MPALNRIPAPPISPQILRCLFGVAGILIGLSSVSAQITAPRTASSTTDRFVRLEEQLVNRLRATAEDQRNYLHFVGAKGSRGQVGLEACRRDRTLCDAASCLVALSLFRESPQVRSGKTRSHPATGSPVRHRPSARWSISLGSSGN